MNKKRIVKNTFLLYIRMFLTIIVGLYTSRVVLNTLGVTDYGIYNVVGGIVAMLAFLNVAMTAASQRFISYELGKGDAERLQKIFSTSVNIHGLIAIVIFILAETIGLWFINTYLNIDIKRMSAANWVYQFSIFTFMASVFSVPYNSCIVAHEHMRAFAYISILDVLLKFAVVYMLLFINVDKLILYSVLVFVVSILVRICYVIYCKAYFKECRYHLIFDKPLFMKMLAFAGWSIIGNLGFSFKDQISNVILNIFFGTTVNAARGIAMQVSGLINSFAGNFSMAINPQITKQYAAGNILESQKLVYAGARYSFYLLTLISIPFMINIDYILKLWLGIVPEYTSIFLILSLLVALLYVITGTVTTAIQATGDVKVFQIGISILMCSEIPAAYVLLKLGFPPYSAMYPAIVTCILGAFFRFYIIKQMIPSYDFTYYTVQVFLRCIILFAFCYLISVWLRSFFIQNLLNLVVTSLLAVCVIIMMVYVLGTTRSERIMIHSKVNYAFNRIAKRSRM